MPCWATWPSAARRSCTEHASGTGRPPLGRAPGVDGDRLRAALGRFATGVAFVTTEAGGSPLGLIVSTFTAVSLQPPLVSFCAARDSFTWRRRRTAGRFAVNVLGARHADFARHAAARGVDRFTGAEFERGESGLPVLVDALALFECGIEAEHLAGDHSIVVGHVDTLRVPGPRLPLVYWAGAFGDSASDRPRAPLIWQRCGASRRRATGCPCSGAYPAPTKRNGQVTVAT